MKRYRVVLIESVQYELVVEAANEADATELAIEAWNQGDTGDGEAMGLGVEAESVEEESE